MEGDYLNSKCIRREYLETAVKWISNDQIEEYMGAQWRYFQDVITWVESTFTTKRSKFMKGVDWGTFYNQFKDEIFDTGKIEAETALN